MSRWLCFALFALMLAPAQAAGATTEFRTSFEAGDPPPAPALERQSGVTAGTQAVVQTATASAENPPNETAPKAFDGSADTKWLAFAPSGWLQAQLAAPVAVVSYTVTSGNDAPGRDPRDWTLAGSDDGATWTALDTQTGQDFGARGQSRSYTLANATAYGYYRLTITANHGDPITQLAELTLDGATAQPGMRVAVDSGPTAGPNIKPNAGFSGLHALKYAGEQTVDGRGYADTKLFDTNLAVTGDSRLSYELFPALGGDLHYPSTYSGVDLVFSDGSTLSDHGIKELYPDQWNHRTVDLGAYAGRTITKILIGYDDPNGKARFSGWLDDLAITAQPARTTSSHLSDWALTTRGTNSSGSFSRGNNFPATAVPHGFNFWTPETNANSLDWLYDYARANNADNLPTLEAFGLSHEPSPWMGDRQTFQVMPSLGTDTSRSARALPFHHANEIAHPNYYAVTFDDGIKGEIAPTDHAAALRFTFPGDATLIFDNVDRGTASLSIDQAHNALTAVSDTNDSNGATPMYIYATFDRPMTASATTRDRTGWAKFSGSTVTMRIATSLISPAQAQRNLALEIAPTDTFDSVEGRAQAAWDRKLGAIEVQGASDDQKTTLYSNLYRLNLYPNSGFEDTPAGIAHMVQSPLADPAVVPGKVYVNNGFWDTYRTAWPAYALLYPKDAGELVDGFVQQYRDTGWISRWSSPGAANLMTGTSSDVAFADAYLKGVKFDAAGAYAAALKDATVAPPGDPFDSDVGRKGLVKSIFLGYTPNQVAEGLSWALEGYINDYGIGNLAAALGHSDEAGYFLSRAQGYTRLFDPRVGFFQGRSASGDWTTDPSVFDPRVWRQGGDYTETDGWNFAFHAPQDGQGLADLYGGRDGLAAKLDQFFATPETAQFPGTYGGTIHEMLEARDVRMGQWGASNQVSHHIPYMYDYAGQPWKTQALVREATRRLFLGSDIGQGYPGDEDNGEMSAWWLFSALGFYPLQAGSPNYVLGSPLFTRAVVHLDGRDLVINAPRNSASNVYVQGVRLNGRRLDRTWFSQRDIARGGTLDFDLGPTPSHWGADGPPPSLTTGAKAPYPLTDAAGLGDGEPSAHALFDDDSRTTASAHAVEFALDRTRHVSYYTLTSAPTAGADPSAWIVKGTSDGRHWKVLDLRWKQTFPWRSQTRPFALRHAADVNRVRIDFAGKPATLGEVEILSDRAVPPSPLTMRADTAAGRAGDTVQVPVTVTDSRPHPPACTLTATGWTTQTGPCTSLDVTIPAGTAPGSYPLRLVARAGGATARVETSITVIGNTITFTPGTDAEAPWLFETGGSQLDGAIYDGHGRFADNGAHFTYRFPVPRGVAQAKLTLELGNEFLVNVSPDNSTWKEVLREPTQEHDQNNYGPRDLTVDTSGSWLYVKVSDAFPNDGWGGWLGKLTLTY